MSEPEAAARAKEILSALNYCHSHSVVHRDLKPENILFDRRDKDPTLKIIDFGTAEIFDPKQKQKLTEGSGTPIYVAPEVLKHSYNSKCDLWSVGVILYMLLSGRPPFTGKTEQDIMTSVVKGKYTMLGIALSLLL
jgi:calcium-dependent protein kinase